MSQNIEPCPNECDFKQKASENPESNGPENTFWSDLLKYLPCVASNRRVQPVFSPSDSSNFVVLRKHCNYHILHFTGKGRGNNNERKGIKVRNDTSPSRFWTGQETDQVDGNLNSSAGLESKDYESDSSLDDYWFTQWTVPIRTVKKLRKEHEIREKRSGVFPRISIRKLSVPKVFGPASKTRSMYSTPPSPHGQPMHSPSPDLTDSNEKAQVESFAAQQSLRIIQTSTEQASALVATLQTHTQSTPNQPVSPALSQVDATDAKERQGHVNPAFVGSDINPDDYRSAVANVQQAILPTTSSNAQHSGSSSNSPSKTSTKPVLFLIHGLGGSANQWTTLINYFSELGYEIVAPDLLGHGFSSAPDICKLYTFRNLLNDLDQIFSAHLPDGRKSVIVAHGYGCAFGVALTRHRIAQVSLLILMSCGSPTMLAPPITPGLPSILVNCLQPCLMCGLKKDSLYAARGKNMIHGDHYHLPPYVKLHISAGQSWPEGDVAFHRRVSVPTLLIYGLKDPHVSLVEMCEMERTIPRAFLELVPNAGHLVMVDAPEAVCKMMRKFLDHWER